MKLSPRILLRCLRLSPAVAWREFWHPILNRGQMLQALVAVIGLRLSLFVAGPLERDLLASNWAIWLKSLGIACVIWATVSLVRAPLIVWANDALKGKWYENRFVFFEPHLVGQFRCRATGQIEMYKFKVPFVEPGAFIYFSLTLDPNVKDRATWDFGGTALVGPMPAAQWPGTGGALLPPNRQAIFRLKLEPDTISTTARVYCHSFTIGEPNETDGTTGNYQFPPRRKTAEDI